MNPNEKKRFRIIYALSGLEKKDFAKEVGISVATLNSALKPSGTLSQETKTSAERFALENGLIDASISNFYISRTEKPHHVVKMIRNALGLTRDDLATTFKVSPKMLFNWERKITPVPASFYMDLISFAEKENIYLKY